MERESAHIEPGRRSTETDETRRLRAEIAEMRAEGAAWRAGYLDEIRRLGEALRAKEEFLSIAAHDLRNPMAGLLLQIESLKRTLGRPGQPVNRDALGRLDALEKQLKHFLKKAAVVLDVSRMASGTMALHLERFNLAELVKEGLETLRPELEHRAIRVSTELPSVVGLWDRGGLEQVVSNLLSNAVKYGGGNPIEIALEDDAQRVTLAVRDHGPGIPKEQRARAFEAFESAVAHRKMRGFGLGLWISRQIVRAHGGELRVEAAPGEGSTFLVELPRSAERHGL